MRHILKKIVEQYVNDIDENKFEDVVYAALSEDVFDDLLSIFVDINSPIPSVFTELPHNINLDATRMPAYLRAGHFIAWLKKFNELLNKIGLLEWNFSKANINIEFSNEEKKKLYGTLTIEELKEIICDSWGVHKEIEEILDKIDNYDDYHKLLQELMGAIYRIYPERDCRNPEELHTLLEELAMQLLKTAIH